MIVKALMVLVTVAVLAALMTVPINAEAAEYVASWSVAGEPISKLTGIQSNEVPVKGEFVVKDGMAEGTATVHVADFKTGDETRDRHMLQTLGADQHPDAVLKLLPVKVSASEFKWLGELTLKGVTKPVWGLATVNGEKLDAKFILNLKEWRTAIEKPRRFGVGIADEVSVTVRTK